VAPDRRLRRRFRLIWEYGRRDGIGFSPDAGTLGETVAALGRGEFAHGVVMNLFSADLFRLQYESALAPEADTAERARALAQFDATIGERYVAFNRWLMDTLADAPAISGFVAMDPSALSPERNVEHLREMAERGARGVKWQDALAIAQAFPNVAFDLSEIIEWAGAPNAPTAQQLATLIRDVGPERVVLGSDYRWYEPAHTAELVLALPGLSQAEKNAILGENAARILRLPV